MQKVSKKKVCSVCGSDQVIEERLVSSYVDSGIQVNNDFMGYCCDVCGDVVDIIPEREYHTKQQTTILTDGLSELLNKSQEMEYYIKDGKIMFKPK